MNFDVTISIATYDRPELLKVTLDSCLRQADRLGLTYEILVTDNHPSGNARTVVEEVAVAASLPVRYQQNTTRDMSVLRNAGIEAARGAYIAFIDDDEVADPSWLDGLMGAIRRTGADIAVGPRLAVFASGRAPAYDPEGRSFARILDLPADALIDLVREDGKPQFGLGTGNSMFALDCFKDGEAFDQAFGNAGGEDAELFVRQYLKGRRIVWAADARVTETVPPHRTDAAYRLVRVRRESQHYVSIYLHHAPRPKVALASLLVKGVIQVAAGAAIALLSWEFGSQARLRGRTLIAYGMAKLKWRKAVGYIDETKFKPPATRPA